MSDWMVNKRRATTYSFHQQLSIDGQEQEWGRGTSDEQLPPAPENVKTKPDNGRITITWDPVPEALYYNLHFQTTKGVTIKPSELNRPIASSDDFNPIIGLKKKMPPQSKVP